MTYFRLKVRLWEPARDENPFLSSTSSEWRTGSISFWKLDAGRILDSGRQNKTPRPSLSIAIAIPCLINGIEKSICFPPGIILFETHLFVGRTLLRIPTEFDDGDKDSYGQSAQQDNKNATCKRLKIGRIHSREKRRE